MDKITLVNLWFDFYGQLLTERQQKFIELYYGNDYSLAEIAEAYQVTRQAVHDTLKRAEGMLRNYEQKLQLVHKFLTQRGKLAEAARLLEECGAAAPEPVLTAREILRQVLEIDRG